MNEELVIAENEYLAECLRYATDLACNIYQKHFEKTAPNWEPLPDLLGVLTQIDNMASGMKRNVD